MSIFTMSINPISGKKEWVEKDEYYDYFQEVARSSYADMLHDAERNQKYNAAIKKAVQSMKDQGRLAKVLDIGTGTGLLSMMAASCGADTITACEVFQPVAKCAEDVIKANKLDHKIKIILKHSTDLTVGPDGDLAEKANILVAEVFDTELIGEGALKTFYHATKNLLEEDCIVIPSAASVFVQIIHSPMISKWNKLLPVHVGPNQVIIPPKIVAACPGSAAVHDIQMSQVPADKFTALTDPTSVFRFDFTGKKNIEMNETFIKQVPVIKKGECEMVFMWWDLKMDMDGDIILNNGPKWVQPEPKNAQWRDHWMQAIYYLPETCSVQEGDKITLTAYHDEYSLWFAIPKTNNKKIADSPTCNCLVHVTDSRMRIGMKNDMQRNNNYMSMLKEIISPSSICLSISDGSLLPLIAAKLGAKKIYSVESSRFHYDMMKSYIEANDEADTICVLSKEPADLTGKDLDMKTVNVLLAEPYFANCVRPWELMRFWHLSSMLRPLLSEEIQIIPQVGKLRGVGVEFDDLWKIRAPLQNVEGFDLAKFDEMIQRAISLADAAIEPHPLWEYPCKPVTKIFEIINCDFLRDSFKDSFEASGEIEISNSGICNGVAIWTDYSYGSLEISSGPVEFPKKDTPIQWYTNCQQGVYFMHPPVPVNPGKQILKYCMSFKVTESSFKFSVIEKN
ncbi:protein arginine N-methyltransferase 7 [Parasteatoda tepidariorum]|uniref:protein arginine N-methyltransferase 7 n=1 Tax=Parasteatoda tepidariorum TaxID=114398 RepID=UPI00077F8377|nr:protein arginine N-methyltransferase 7 [Parasteatoda tepidariorum]